MSLHFSAIFIGTETIWRFLFGFYKLLYFNNFGTFTNKPLYDHWWFDAIIKSSSLTLDNLVILEYRNNQIFVQKINQCNPINGTYREGSDFHHSCWLEFLDSERFIEGGGHDCVTFSDVVEDKLNSKQVATLRVDFHSFGVGWLIPSLLRRLRPSMVRTILINKVWFSRYHIFVTAAEDDADLKTSNESRRQIT